MSRFYPPSGGAKLAYDLYVVSGMVRNGLLIVSWSTGKPATQQIDYGIEDKSVPQQTPIPVDSNGQRIYTVFHEVTFPQTFVDTNHYFRVRSINRTGKELVSAVFKVFVTGIIVQSSELTEISVTLEKISPQPAALPTATTTDSSVRADAGPEGSSEVTLVQDATKQAVAQPATANQQTTFETNITTQIS